VFRDELTNLFPDDARAGRLSTLVSSLGEFLAKYEDQVPPMTLPYRALVHEHCHQKALFRGAGSRVLDRLGLDYEIVDAGCCGMAGSFGFERDHYGVSQAVGERRLLPRARNAGSDTLLIADGFSCREQITQSTSRAALHLADVLAIAKRQPMDESAGSLERAQVRDYSHERLPWWRIAAAVLLAAGAVAAITGTRRSPLRR